MKGFGSFEIQRLRNFHQNEAHRESGNVATCSICAFLPLHVKFLFGYYTNLTYTSSLEDTFSVNTN